ncbi:SLC13 family permease [Leifsonia sp. NPDC080035]|uniref:SLC13 family permease n=1 Tax=Leifsonia sp. NPDC080035 TaxID=3143936 RepID=A0AAU7GB32_9MICO
MTPHIAITLAVILTAMGFFIWNRVPAAVVAIGASLVLFFTGVISVQETLSGFGDPVVILIVALLAIAVGLENAGVGVWAGQLLLQRTGTNPTVRLVAIMLAAAIFSGLIGMNGAVAAMLPIAVLVAVRTDTAPSRLMIPLAFACLTGAKLTLLGSPVNVIAATQADEAGVGHIGFFEWALLGIPLLAGTIAITALLGKRLLPERHSASIPADLSRHAVTLVEQYKLDDGLHWLRVRDTSPLVGRPPADVDLAAYPGLALVTVLQSDGASPVTRGSIAIDDQVLVRGDEGEIGRLAGALHLGLRPPTETASVAGSLVGRDVGLAEVVIPQRSAMIGRSVFPGMTTDDGGMQILAVQRGGDDVRDVPVDLQAGDHLLLQGSWTALDTHLADPQLLVVDSPDVVKRQTVALGRGAPAAIGILVLLVVLLAFDLVPPAIAAVLCAALMVVFRVVKLPDLFHRIDWNTPILIGAMIPPAIAMMTSGAAALIGDYVVTALGAAGPYAVLAGLFLVSALISQFISNTSAALVMIPIGLATAYELGVSALPMMLAVAMGASASFLTPFANGVSLMVYGPGGYRFGDFWRLGLVVLAWTLIVSVVVIPLVWHF